MLFRVQVVSIGSMKGVAKPIKERGLQELPVVMVIIHQGVRVALVVRRLCSGSVLIGVSVGCIDGFMPVCRSTDFRETRRFEGVETSACKIDGGGQHGLWV